MITLIQKLFQGDRQQTSPADHELKKRVASCALLLETAYADDECSPVEMERIVETVKTRFALSPEYVSELLELADRERQKSADLWSFTNDLNQLLSREEKLAVLEDVWRIIFADGRLESHEDYLAHKLANLLRLSHQDLITAKLAARGEN
jgi:uncharacterized tellurite resistance protein B-like protein